MKKKKINESFKKWEPVLNNIGLGSNNAFDILKNTTINDISNFELTQTILPIVVHSFGVGYWKKSKRQQLREDRLNKILKIEGKEPNRILPNDEYIEGIDSLVPVQSLSTPKITLIYSDYKYESKPKKITFKYIYNKCVNNIKKIIKRYG